MSKAKNRPPRLESQVGPQEVAPPPTLRGAARAFARRGPRALSPGPSEIRRLVERAATDRAQPVPLDDAWASVQRGVRRDVAEAPQIDPDAHDRRRTRRGACGIVEVAEHRRAHRARDEQARVVACRSTSRSRASPASPAATSPTMMSEFSHPNTTVRDAARYQLRLVRPVDADEAAHPASRLRPLNGRSSRTRLGRRRGLRSGSARCGR